MIEEENYTKSHSSKALEVFFKLLGISLIATLFFIIGSAALPFSPNFIEKAQDASPFELVFIVMVHLWFAATVFYIGKHAEWKNKWLIGSLIFVYATVYCFMTQIETLFFGAAFPGLSDSDAWVIMLANLIPLLLIVPLTLMVTKRSTLTTPMMPRWSLITLISRILLLGGVYALIYFVFGYFVAWQFADLRWFYSGSTDKQPFISHMISNIQDSRILSFQLLRGVLFSTFILPVVLMLYHKRQPLLISLILVYLSTAVVLIIPNFLFPDSVRWVHFIEMSSSMTLFAVITWWIWRKPDSLL